MPPEERDQKSAVRIYRGNPGYFRRTHGWRRLRFWLPLGLVLLAVGLGIAYWFSGREEFYSTGPLTRAHAELNCADCHETNSAFPGTLRPQKLSALNQAALVAVDQECRSCHQPITVRHAAFAGEGESAEGLIFAHVPSVSPAEDRLCLECHQAHTGPGKMPDPALRNCTDCHGDPARMQLLVKGDTARRDKLLTWTADTNPARRYFQAPPPRTFEAIASFTDGHPEFRPLQAGLSDPNTLKFGHLRHQGKRLPDGTPLTCLSCHRPDVSGAYFLPPTYEMDCRSCHPLQFDPARPDLAFPHAEPRQVRQFIYGLRSVYEDSLRASGVPAADAGREAEESLTSLQRTYGAGSRRELAQTLHRNAFFQSLLQPGGGAAESQHVRYNGCVACHEVTASADPAGLPTVTPPAIMDRWLGHGRFDHSQHTTATDSQGRVRRMDCLECHAGPGQSPESQWVASNRTADILLPGIDSCIRCHQPAAQGGTASDSCYECHRYHPPASLRLRSTLREPFAGN